MSRPTSSDDLAGWLRQRRQTLGLGQHDLSQLTGDLGGPDGRVTQPYLSRLERGERALGALTAQRQDALRRALDVTLSEWTARTGLRALAPAPREDLLGSLELIRVPVRALASAGLPLTEDHASVIDYELVPLRDHRPGMLVLQVQGDSMTTEHGGLRPGDRVYVDPGDLDLREGRVYVLHVPGLGLTVKRLRRYGDQLWLSSDNPDHPPVRPEEATVIGRVYYHQPQGQRL
ncbi:MULTISPECIES: S24 family peptidase [Deinococcus]|uniref:LexA repressor n=2 Tax=Deinococcus soli (ex Cha et al. 2016) TaxID=1309411 RepID=A0A0F7JRK9_9DEIO|nr:MULTISPECIES: S24 family peptidase [Deinococcus]AKH17215.1 LexA repressor [Deinococcus soli (ex Cha et al. 2016)]MDK2014274.1 LexA family transcriptional regulator [Deinococcus sp. 43]MDR6221373.1 repressor LexA [Deinococcus soli (ex Cha et al. 2016)]MDR6331342.1 repressor LexA [Deinococcus soli (ex Cha et al. 2016)]MDR6754522.1 repressor LexA [Deinococcus soli (ex Cha et al. 2016)]